MIKNWITSAIVSICLLVGFPDTNATRMLLDNISPSYPLDVLCSQPEWNGKRNIVNIGGQALAVLGLDSKVSVAVATVSALYDLLGQIIGRQGGWPNSLNNDTPVRNLKSKTVPYLDTAHLLKNSKASLVVKIGFIDKTCPSASIYAAINQAIGEKIIYGIRNRDRILKHKSYGGIGLKQ